MSRAQLTSTVEQNTGGAVAPFVAGKNKVINGDFAVAQRGNSFVSPTTGAYTLDRWQDSHDGSGTTTVSQQAFTAGTAPVASYEAPYFIQSTLTSVGSSSFIGFIQPIEDVRTFAGQTVTLSFWAKADSARTSLVYLYQNFGSGGSSGVYAGTPSVTYSTSWARYAFTFSIPSISGKTIGTGSSLTLGIRSTATSGSVLSLWGVQLEAGSVATPFTTASNTLQGELALCQRYYYRTGTEAAYQYLATAAVDSATTVLGTIFFPVKMRTAPTLSSAGSWMFYVSATIKSTASQPSGDAAASTIYGINLIGFTGLTAGQSGNIRANNDSTAYVAFSAEL
jgi:hypothetical protein